MQPATSCHYSLLGVALDASNEEIVAAYARRIARFRRRLAEGRPLPVEHLDALREAHRILCEPESRADYDRLRKPEPTLTEHRPLPAGWAEATSVAFPREDKTSNEARVEFHGEGNEYMRIWLVNVALNILTLGIYSAWAKVRREKYFHRNFMVDGAAFDYHGSPRAILTGRIFLVLMLALMNLSEGLHPAAHMAAIIAAMFGFPWLLLRSLQFRARNTSYRGLRFSFEASYGAALKLYLLHGFLTGVTFGLYFPAFLRHQKAFLAEHLSFGGMRCTFNAQVTAFYRGLVFPMLLWILLGVGSALLLVVIASGAGKGGAVLMAMIYGPLALAALAMLVNVIVIPYAHVVGTNLLWNSTQVGEVHFRSSQRVRPYLGLTLSNWLLTLLTLGFFWPLAQIRKARYRAQNLVVLNPNAIDGITGRGSTSSNALGDAATDAFGFDIGL